MAENVFPSEFPILQTERFRLRQVRMEDAENLFAIYSDPVVMQYFGNEVKTELQEAYDMIERRLTFYAEGRMIRWVITEQEQDQAIGTIGFHALSKQNRSAEIGYDLKREMWGRGITSEVIAAVLEYGFTQMNLHRIAGQISPENTASKRVLEKVGFQYEGTMRQDIFFQGKFHDTSIYSLLRAEYTDQTE